MGLTLALALRGEVPDILQTLSSQEEEDKHLKLRYEQDVAYFYLGSYLIVDSGGRVVRQYLLKEWME